MYLLCTILRRLALFLFLAVITAYGLLSAVSAAYARDRNHDHNDNTGSFAPVPPPGFTINVAEDGLGGFFVVWHQRQGKEYDVYISRFDNTGKNVWNPKGNIISDASGDQVHPQVIPDGLGGAIITWHNISDQGIYAQRLESSGKTLWKPEGVFIGPSTGKLYYSPSNVPVTDGAHGAIIIWNDGPGSGHSYTGYAQRLDTSGTKLWGEQGVVVSRTEDFPPNFEAAPDGFRGALISWHKTYRSGEDNAYVDDILAQRLDASGKTLWSNEGITVEKEKRMRSLQVVPDGTGGTILVMEREYYGTNTGYLGSDIAVQRIDTSGNIGFGLSGVRIISNEKIYDLRGEPDGFGGAIIAWYTYERPNKAFDIYAQRTDQKGTLLWGTRGVRVSSGAAFVNNVVEPIPATHTRVVPDGSGGAVFSWQEYDYGRFGYNYSIGAQRLSASGKKQWAGQGIVIETAEELDQNTISPSNHMLISDGSGGAHVIVWDDRALTGAPQPHLVMRHLERDVIPLGNITKIAKPSATREIESSMLNKARPIGFGAVTIIAILILIFLIKKRQSRS